jgi:hypothetical protein
MMADLVAAGAPGCRGQPSPWAWAHPAARTPEGLMKNCNSTCLNGMPLQRDVQAAIGQPVQLANDANCLALSEATDGAAADAAVVFAAILGTGTGAGIAVHGRVLQGPNGLAGEWGHNPLPWGEPGEDPPWACYCGQRHCVEAWSAAVASHATMPHATAAAWTGHHRPARPQGDADCRATLQRHSTAPGAGAGRCHQPAGPGRHRARRRPVAHGAPVHRGAGAVGPLGVCRRRAGAGAHTPAAGAARRRFGRARRGLAGAGGGVSAPRYAEVRAGPRCQREGALGPAQPCRAWRSAPWRCPAGLAVEAALVHVGHPFVVDGGRDA